MGLDELFLHIEYWCEQHSINVTVFYSVIAVIVLLFVGAGLFSSPFSSIDSDSGHDPGPEVNKTVELPDHITPLVITDGLDLEVQDIGKSFAFDVVGTAGEKVYINLKTPSGKVIYSQSYVGWRLDDDGEKFFDFKITQEIYDQLEDGCNEITVVVDEEESETDCIFVEKSADDEDECSSDSDCASGESCASGECKIDEPECTSDSDCDVDEVCTDGECKQDTSITYTFDVETTQLNVSNYIEGVLITVSPPPIKSVYGYVYYSDTERVNLGKMVRGVTGSTTALYKGFFSDYKFNKLTDGCNEVYIKIDTIELGPECLEVDKTEPSWFNELQLYSEEENITDDNDKLHLTFKGPPDKNVDLKIKKGSSTKKTYDEIVELKGDGIKTYTLDFTLDEIYEIFSVDGEYDFIPYLTDNSSFPNEEVSIDVDLGDQCDTIGEKRCYWSGQTKYVICMDAGDRNVWGTPNSCSSGLICQDGECVDVPCTDQCSLGDARCGVADAYEICGYWANDCLDWDLDPTCTSGVCDTGEEDPVCACTDGEFEECYTYDSTTADVGECYNGTQTCSSGDWGTCQNEQGPISELCDGKDNDCDGEMDEDFTTIGDDCTVGGQSGVLECAYDGSDVQCCVPGAIEVCDNIDNDCDGQLDEGELCGPGGVCAGGSCYNNAPDFNITIVGTSTGAELTVCNSGYDVEPGVTETTVRADWKIIHPDGVTGAMFGDTTEIPLDEVDEHNECYTHDITTSDIEVYEDDYGVSLFDYKPTWKLEVDPQDAFDELDDDALGKNVVWVAACVGDCSDGCTEGDTCYFANHRKGLEACQLGTSNVRGLCLGDEPFSCEEFWYNCADITTPQGCETENGCSPDEILLSEFLIANDLHYDDIESFTFNGEGDLTNLVINQKTITDTAKLKDMTNLLELRLQNADLQFFPDLRGYDSIKTLVLSGNDFDLIPLWLNDLTTLEHFWCASCGITEFPPAVFDLTELRSLTLGQNQIAEPIPNAIQNLPNLASLYLQNNYITGPVPSSKILNITNKFYINNNCLGSQDILDAQALCLERGTADCQVTPQQESGGCSS